MLGLADRTFRALVARGGLEKVILCQRVVRYRVEDIQRLAAPHATPLPPRVLGAVAPVPPVEAEPGPQRQADGVRHQRTTSGQRDQQGTCRVRRIVWPVANVQGPVTGDKHVLEVKGQQWVHETFLVPLVMQGRSTAELAGASVNAFDAWQSTGAITPRALARTQRGSFHCPLMR